MFESTALHILYVPHNTEKGRHTYKSKYNFKRENQVVLLMITDGEKWHYLALKRLSALFTEVASKHNGELKQINIHHLVIHCLHTVRLIQQKISLITIEAKIV